jgi:hypothetical protein
VKTLRPIVFALLAVIASQVSRPAETAERNRAGARRIQFAGHEWRVKSSSDPMGADPGQLSDSIENVRVDDKGPLLLKILDGAVAVDSSGNTIQHRADLPEQIAQDRKTLQFADSDRVEYTQIRSADYPVGIPIFDCVWEVLALHHNGGFLVEPGVNESSFFNECVSVCALARGLQRRGRLSS